MSTITPNGIFSDGVEVSGFAYNNGPVAIIERGICYGLTSRPIITDNKVAARDEDYIIGTRFTVKLTQLKPQTLYYARTYAIGKVNNRENKYYANEVTFTTP